MKNIYLIALAAYGMSLLPAVAQTNEKDPALRNLPEAMYGKAKTQKWLKELPPMPSPEEVARKNKLKTPLTAASQLRAATTMKLDSTITMYAESNTLPGKQIYTYNEAGKITSETSYYKWNNVWEGNGHTEYAYDAAGNNTLRQRFLSDGQLWIEDQYTYDSNNRMTENSTIYYENGIPEEEYTQEYDASGNQILYEARQKDENGEWYVSYRYVYAYDSEERQTTFEEWNWNGNELQLDNAQYFTYDSEGRQTHSQFKSRNDDYLIVYSYDYAYDAQGRQTLYEYKSDDASLWRHQIETWSYADDNSGLYTSLDSTRMKNNDNRLNVSASSSDCTYDEDGNVLTEERYVADPATGNRGAIVQSNTYTYNENGQTVLSEYSYYSNGLLNSKNKTETEYEEDGRSYTSLYYYQPAGSEEWELTSGDKYEYDYVDTRNYSYIYSDLDVETNEWIDTYGRKYEYTGDIYDYERLYSDWDTETDTWVITGGEKHIYEMPGDGNEFYYDASWDTSTNTWSLNYGYKTEMSGDNPQIETRYNCTGGPEDFELYSTTYSYYSALATANETLSPIATMKVYPTDGGLRIETTQAGTIAIYAISGRCVYMAPADGNMEVNGLDNGIYIVKWQTTTGEETIKVRLK